MRVQEAVAAFGAFACGIILEELYLSPAFGALDVENGPRLPVLAVLSRTFHYFSPKVDGLVKSLQVRHSRESGSPQVLEFPGFPLSRE